MSDLPERLREYDFAEHDCHDVLREAADQIEVLLEVAEAAAVLFRPPYRRGNAGILLPVQQSDNPKLHDDFERLYNALTSPSCPVEIGEELT